MNAPFPRDFASAHDSAAEHFRPGRLWSLLDVMQLFQAVSFMGLAHRTGLIISGLMADPNGVVPDSLRIEVQGSMRSLETRLLEFDLIASLATVRKLIKLLEHPCSNAEFGEKMLELYPRLEDELTARRFFVLSQKEIGLMDPQKPLFGEWITEAFPLAGEDIAEAGKCLALRRYTACVFHLMRAMETAVRALGVKIGATVLDRNNRDLEWGKMVNNISVKIATLPASDKKDLWSESASLLGHVRIAWRNPTMHPKQTYSEEEAEEVFNSVKAFMGHLSLKVMAS